MREELAQLGPALADAVLPEIERRLTADLARVIVTTPSVKVDGRVLGELTFASIEGRRDEDLPDQASNRPPID